MYNPHSFWRTVHRIEKMMTTVTLETLEESASGIRARSDIRPRVAVVLGSGLGALADEVESPDIFPYAELPGWPPAAVAGHAGQLFLGRLEGCAVAVLQGRAHYYEGWELAEVTFPLRVLRRLGVEAVILTNAAGAVNPGFNPGDLMLITDHLNLIGLGGANPLRGPNDDRLGPRFPDLSCAYDRGLLALARTAAAEEGISIREGVYACVAGPSFETPADLRFLRAAGADAVGMSTVPETIVARHDGMRVLGVSAISNKPNLDGCTPTTHADVLDAGGRMAPQLIRLVRRILAKMDTECSHC
jgi:purine-nucleoside phosphorylase